MSFWDDITGKVSEGSKIVADKAKEVSEIANLRAQLVGCDNTIIKNYKELGKAFYAAHKDDADVEFAEIISLIKETEAKKEELNAALADRKGGSKDASADIVDDIVDKVEDVAADVAEKVDDVTSNF